MKAKRAVPFVSLAVCALLAAAFSSGAQAQAGPAQTLLDGKLVGNLGGFIVGTDTPISPAACAVPVGRRATTSPNRRSSSWSTRLPGGRPVA